MDVCNLTLRDDFRISPGDIRGSVEVIKEGRMFINSLPGGEIPCQDMGGLGFYFADTRFLSCLELRLNGVEPVFLSRTLRDSHFAQVEMTNKEFTSNGQTIPLQTIHLRLFRMVKESFYQRIRLINFYPCPLKLNLQIKLGADFADIFEVRGTPRSLKGIIQKPVIQKHKVILSYLGQDNIRRFTEISFSPSATRIAEEDLFIIAEYQLKLEPKKKYYFYLKVTPLVGKIGSGNSLPKSDLGFTEAAEYLINAYQGWKEKCLRISSDNERFNFMSLMAITDLRALRSTYPGLGTIVEAGIPWFAAPFGRDSLITAWQTLLLNPSLAKETLCFLAKYQGREVNPWRDEQPGKIMHEMRFGEMAMVGEIPHTPYYGSVDATLWFIILIADYLKWTGDRSFFREMAVPLAKALQWCDEYGDIDQDGYIEYLCQSKKGLFNQGWKDSWDGVVDRDGNIPTGPVALVEVQAYYYKALIEAAAIYKQTGDGQKAAALGQKAETLQQKFWQDFWLEGQGFLAYALDSRKKLIKTVVSNAGHCLFTGILADRQARRVADRLMRPDLFSGWGIRTMSSEEAAYNPMSYHNGTVWPHDNAIIGYGMRKAGRIKQLKQLAESLFEAAQHFEYMRLPELFCGFTKHENMGPVKYPIACDPQAWAAGSIFLLLRALLGIKCRGNEIHICDPHLPEFLQTLRLENIRVGNGLAGLEFTRRQNKTYGSVVETEGNIKVIFEKEV